MAITGPILHFKCEETSSPLVSSVGSYTGAFPDGVTPNQEGKFGKCVLVNDANATEITLNTPIAIAAADGEAGAFTISAWVKHASGNAWSANAICGETANYLRVWSSTAVDCRIDGTTRNVNSGITLSTGDWIFLGATRDASGNMKLYIDKNSHNFSDSNTGAFNIAAFGNLGVNGASPFDGYMDDIRVYDRELSESDMALLASDSLYSRPAVSPGVASNIVLPVAYSPSDAHN
jgi:hypothetical protein